MNKKLKLLTISSLVTLATVSGLFVHSSIPVSSKVFLNVNSQVPSVTSKVDSFGLDESIPIPRSYNNIDGYLNKVEAKNEYFEFTREEDKDDEDYEYGSLFITPKLWQDHNAEFGHFVYITLGVYWGDGGIGFHNVLLIDSDVNYNFSYANYNYDDTWQGYQLLGVNADFLKDGLNIFGSLMSPYEGEACYIPPVDEDIFFGLGITTTVSDGEINDGETAVVNEVLDQAHSIESIIESVKLSHFEGDAVDIYISDQEKAKYKPDFIGVYTLSITVTDRTGYKAACFLEIHVEDHTPPVITLIEGAPLEWDNNLNKHLIFADLPKHFVITDNGVNHGGTIENPSFRLDGTELTGDFIFEPPNMAGSHTLTVVVKDSSGNVGAKDFPFQVLDKVGPEIELILSNKPQLKTSLGVANNLQDKDLLELFHATDGYGGIDEDVSNSLYIDGDLNVGHVGNRSVIIKAQDVFGNDAAYDLNLDVIKDLPSVFILDDTLVLASVQNPLTHDQLLSIMNNTVLSGKKVLKYSINDSHYQTHATEVSNEPINVPYTLTLALDDGSQVEEQGDLRIIRRARSLDDTPLSWWDSMIKAISDGFKWFGEQCSLFFQRIGNWFRGIFTKWKWDCWLTNEEWDQLYPEGGN